MSLELVMIVKNSGYILKSVLESIKDYIDYWTILDTGSTDGTQELIKSTLSNVNGKLWEEPFTNFRDSRNRSLDLSSKKCKWTIILDDSYQVQNPGSLKQFLSLKTTSLNTYHIKIVDSLEGGTYDSIRIIRTNSNKRYEKYKIHESIIDYDAGQIPQDISYIVDLCSGEHIYRSRKRFERDIKMLLEEDQNDLRVIYYLAKTYYTIGNKEEGVKYYNKVIDFDKKGRSNEKYEAMMAINSSKYDDKTKDHNPDNYKKDYGAVFVQYPFRVEPLFGIFSKEYKRGDVKSAYSFIKLCIKVKEPKSYPYEYNFNLYRFIIPYFYIDLSLKMGQINSGVECLKNVLQKYPDRQEFLNIKYNITQHPTNFINLSSGKTVVIHTGNKLFSAPWNKDNIHELGSGSEIMAIKLAESFANYGYRAFIIGYFKNDKVDYQAVRDDVQYIDYTYFNEFSEKYNIDIMIISRYLDNLLYYDNIKNVFLWVHDIYPQGNDFLLQTHPEKFKSFLCMSNWHVKTNKENYDLPEKSFFNLGNGIKLSRFSLKEPVKKIHHRYIWTSNLFRGVDYAVDMFGEIKKRYPEAELHIYGNNCNVDLKNIQSIFLHNRVDQDTLTVELLKSDVWLYPNDFVETYCISAVEAQAAGCLVCCNVHAGLEDTVNDRGAVITGKYDKERLLEELFKIQDNPVLKNITIEKGKKYADTQNIDNLVPKIINLLR